MYKQVQEKKKNLNQPKWLIKKTHFPFPSYT